MEKYIKKINDKLLAMEDKEKALKQKKVYKIVGYSLLGVGLAGFVACFIAFMVLFLKFQTESAFTLWIIAIPFLLILVPGSVLARVGDVLINEDKKEKVEKLNLTEEKKEEIK